MTRLSVLHRDDIYAFADRDFAPKQNRAIAEWLHMNSGYYLDPH